MKVLIVHAHPEPQSFNGAMTRTAHEVLTEMGHDVVVSDLYQMQFDPVSSRKNFTEIFDGKFLKLQNEEMHAARHGGFESSLEAEIVKLEQSDLVIFQFPLWWFGMPAILKGWVDRVLAMGRVYSRGGVYASGHQLKRRAILSLTTGAPAEFFSGSIGYPTIEEIIMPIRKGVFEYIGFEFLEPHKVHQPARLGDKQRKVELLRWAERLDSLF
jgi:NAD(P)H dehydrogenase (quinone)